MHRSNPLWPHISQDSLHAWKRVRKIAISCGLDRHFCRPRWQKSCYKGKTSGDTTRKCSNDRLSHLTSVNKVSLKDAHPELRHSNCLRVIWKNREGTNKAWSTIFCSAVFWVIQSFWAQLCSYCPESHFLRLPFVFFSPTWKSMFYINGRNLYFLSF